MNKKKLKAVANFLILLGNLAFVYIWGLKGWQETELFSTGWYFDARGHFIFGLMWGFAWLYFIKRYSPTAYLLVPKTDVASIIIARVIIMAVLWEGIELFWDLKIQPDFASWLAKAQKDSADTTLDIIITTFGTVIDMPFWWAYRKYYEWRWPNAATDAAIEEARERADISAEEISAMQKEHKKQVIAKIKAKWEKIFQEK